MYVFHRKLTIVDPIGRRLYPEGFFSGKYLLKTWCGFAMMDLNNWWSLVLPLDKASNVGKSCGKKPPGLLIPVAPRYRYCSGATFTVAVAVAPLLLNESSGDGSAATFLAAYQRYSLPLLLKNRTNFFPLLIFLRAVFSNPVTFHVVDMLLVTYMHVPSPFNL